LKSIRKYLCPKCRESEGIDITYGMPGTELVEMAGRSQAWIGGCCLSDDMPDRHCLACHHEWQIKRRRDPLGLPVLPEAIAG
jgi:hypothetical protein